MNVNMLSNRGGHGDIRFGLFQIMRDVTCVILEVSTRMQHRLHGHTHFCRQLRAGLRNHFAALTPNTPNGHSSF